MLARRRIMEWYDYWDGQVYVSFSGGMDSTVLLALVRMTLGSEIPAVFCNTGLEFPEIIQFARSFQAYGAYEEIRPATNFRQVILRKGIRSSVRKMQARSENSGMVSYRPVIGITC